VLKKQSLQYSCKNEKSQKTKMIHPEEAYLSQKTAKHEDYRFVHFLGNGSNTKESDFLIKYWKIPLKRMK